MIKIQKNALVIFSLLTVFLYIMNLTGCCGGPSRRDTRYPENQDRGANQNGQEEEDTVVKYIGETFKYLGSMTNESDPVDVFTSDLPADLAKTKITEYMRPFKPEKESYGKVFFLSYPNSVIVVDPIPGETDKQFDSFEKAPEALSRIRVYPPEIAARKYNSSSKNVYVHEYYDPYYYHRHRNRYLSVHFRGNYGGWYRNHYGNRWGRMKPRYGGGYSRYRYGGRGNSRSRGRIKSGRGFGNSRKSYSSSGFRGGGNSWGK